MSRTRRILAAAALFLFPVASGLLAQNGPPGGVNDAVLRDPQNAPLPLKSDIRTLVGLDAGFGGGPLGLKADVDGLEGAMRDLGAQVRKVEIPAQVKIVADRKIEIPAQVKEIEIQVDLPGDVLFDFDKVDLKPAAQETLKKLTIIIRARSKGAVQINGYTDSKGSDPHNQKLSEGRAASVKAWLTTNGGIAPAGLTTRGFGKAAPVVPNTHPDGSDSPEGRARNRRVEVIIPTQ